MVPCDLVKSLKVYVAKRAMSLQRKSIEIHSTANMATFVIVTTFSVISKANTTGTGLRLKIRYTDNNPFFDHNIDTSMQN